MKLFPKNDAPVSRIAPNLRVARNSRIAVGFLLLNAGALAAQPAWNGEGVLSAVVIESMPSDSGKAWLTRNKKQLDSLRPALAQLSASACGVDARITLQHEKGRVTVIPYRAACAPTEAVQTLAAFLPGDARKPNARAWLLEFDLAWRVDAFLDKSRNRVVWDEHRSKRMENGFITLLGMRDTARVVAPPLSPGDSGAAEVPAPPAPIPLPGSELRPQLRAALDSLFPLALGATYTSPAPGQGEDSFTLLYRFADTRYQRVRWQPVAARFPYAVRETMSYVPRSNRTVVYTELAQKRVRAQVGATYRAVRSVKGVN